MRYWKALLLGPGPMPMVTIEWRGRLPPKRQRAYAHTNGYRRQRRRRGYGDWPSRRVTGILAAMERAMARRRREGRT